MVGRLLIIGVVAWGLAGCSTTKKVHGVHAVSVIESVGKPNLDSFPQPKQRLLNEANNWIGVKYRYGGTTRDGVDCSGLTMQVYDNALNIKLPRNSDEQRQWCEPLRRDQMGEGDLVFFSPKGNKGGVNHVAIYLGNNKFVHASTSSGVIVSSLDEPYYDQRYHSSGRVARYYAMIEAAGTKEKKVSVESSVADITKSIAEAEIRPTSVETKPVKPVKKIKSSPTATGDSIIKIARRTVATAADTLSADEARSRMLRKLREQNNDL
ncbi:MAG: C40 family peptidase [Paramuribaculum sp.]|nr:C40 family peptidase [Paramuribaculum sp.]